MKTGLKKNEKATGIYFDEASPVIEIHTQNTGLKKQAERLRRTLSRPIQADRGVGGYGSLNS